MIQLKSLVSTVIVGVSCLLLTTLTPVVALKCRSDGAGSPVDWFITMKYPANTDASGSPGVSADAAQRLADGWAYAYMDATTKSSGMVGSKYSLTDKKNTALAKTLAPLYDRKNWNSVGWIFYNDQTKALGVSVKSGCGHSKGLIAFDKTGAIWIVHSHPVYPPPPKDGYKMTGADDFGQTYFCASLSVSDFAELSQNMDEIQPGIYSSNYPAALTSLYPQVADILKQKWSRDGEPVVAAVASGLFTHIAKDSKWGGSTAVDSDGYDMYPDLIAPTLESPIYVQTWYRPAGATGRTQPSICDPPYAIAEKINSIQLDPKWPTYPSWNDHSKWAITMDATVGTVCVGDLNFQWSQRARAGGMLCIRDKSVYKTFQSFIVTISNCGDADAVTPAFDYKKDAANTDSAGELHVASAEEIAAASAMSEDGEQFNPTIEDGDVRAPPNVGGGDGTTGSIPPYAIGFVPLAGPVWYNGSFWCGIVIGMFVALIWKSYGGDNSSGSGSGSASGNGNSIGIIGAPASILAILVVILAIVLIANPSQIQVVTQQPTRGARGRTSATASKVVTPTPPAAAAAAPAVALLADADDGSSGDFDYYQSIDSERLSGSALYKALQRLIDKPNVPGYKAVPAAFASIDAGRGDCPATMIGDVYSKKCWLSTEKCGNYKKAGDCWNIEHSWPKGWWDYKKNSHSSYSDLHHLFPSDGWVNSKRSDYPFGNVKSPVTTYEDGSKLGPCSSDGGSGTCFEPSDRMKGELARAQFYVSTAYGHEFRCCEKASVSLGALKSWSEEILKEWHQRFPPTRFEIKRNDAIYKRQGNRNPYIDRPDWVWKIDFTSVSTAPDPVDDEES